MDCSIERHTALSLVECVGECKSRSGKGSLGRKGSRGWAHRREISFIGRIDPWLLSASLSPTFHPGHSRLDCGGIYVEQGREPQKQRTQNHGHTTEPGQGNRVLLFLPPLVNLPRVSLSLKNWWKRLLIQRSELREGGTKDQDDGAPASLVSALLSFFFLFLRLSGNNHGQNVESLLRSTGIRLSRLDQTQNQMIATAALARGGWTRNWVDVLLPDRKSAMSSRWMPLRVKLSAGFEITEQGLFSPSALMHAKLR
jgi:hypothetical protein